MLLDGAPMGDLLLAFKEESLSSFRGVLRDLPYNVFITMARNFWSYPRVVKYSIGEKD